MRQRLSWLIATSMLLIFQIMATAQVSDPTTSELVENLAIPDASYGAIDQDAQILYLLAKDTTPGAGIYEAAIWIIDLETATVIAKVPIGKGGNCLGMALCPGRNELWIPRGERIGSNTPTSTGTRIKILDTVNRVLLPDIDLSMTNDFGLGPVVFDSSGNTAIVCHHGQHAVLAFDTATRAQIASYAMASAEEPQAIVLSANDSRAYVVDKLGLRLHALNVPALTSVGGLSPLTLSLPPSTSSVSICRSAAGRIFVSSNGPGAGDVAVVDETSLTQIAAIPTLGSRLKSVRLTADERFVLAADPANQLLHVIDVGTQALVRSIPLAGTPNGIVVSNDPKTTAIISLSPPGALQFLRPPYPGIGRDLILLMGVRGSGYGAPHIVPVVTGDTFDLAMFSPQGGQVGGLPYLLVTPFFGSAPNPGIFPGVYGLNGPIPTELLYDGNTACGSFGPCSFSPYGLVLPTLTLPSYLATGLHLLFQGAIVGAKGPGTYASTNAYRLDL